MVRCYDCGLLAAPYRSEGTLEEVPKFSRDSGSPTRTSRGFPVCLALAFDLPQEYEHRSVSRAGTSAGITPADVVPVLHRERECDDFTTWRQGFSPKDHIEAMDREKLQERMRRQEQEDREWREKIEARDREWRQEDLDRADRIEKENRQHRRNQFLFVAFTSIVTAVAILIAGFSGVLSSL